MADDSAYPTPLAPSTLINDSLEWDCEWGRCVDVGESEGVDPLSNSFKPGRYAYLFGFLGEI